MGQYGPDQVPVARKVSTCAHSGDPESRAPTAVRVNSRDLLGFHSKKSLFLSLVLFVLLHQQKGLGLPSGLPLQGGTLPTTREQEASFRLPNVQLIGAQKAGTTALAKFLFDNAGFCNPKISEAERSIYSKEVHFFDIKSCYEEGDEFYAERFQHCPLHGNIMDATPDTLPFAERVRGTYEAAGGDQRHFVKIIVILRDPIARELSLYNHLAYLCRYTNSSQRNGWEKQVARDDGSILSFDEFIFERSIPALGNKRSTRFGMYAVHLRKWFELFDRKQILVLSYDELRYHPNRLLERVKSFLGLGFVLGNLTTSNDSEDPFKVREPSPQAREALSTIFAPLNSDLYELLESNSGPVMEQRPFPRFQ
jgi:Sulfotransferase domain